MRVAMLLPNKELRLMFRKPDGSRMSAHEARLHLERELERGHKVIPIGERCEGFSYETGCPGHPYEEQVQ